MAYSKQSPSLIQTLVPSSAASREGESKSAASKVLFTSACFTKKTKIISLNLFEMMIQLQLQNNELAAEMYLKWDEAYSIYTCI